MKAYIVSGLLALSAISWADTLQGHGRRCRDGQYFDDVDNVCVQGGTVWIIDGVSQEEIMAIAEQEGPALARIQGVKTVGVDRHGIGVEVEVDHDPVPDSVQGHHIHLIPDRGPRVALSHTPQ